LKSVIFLLDSSPRSWSTREEFAARLCRALAARNIGSVFTYSEDLPGEISGGLERAGAVVTTLRYRDGYGRYFSGLGALVRRHEVFTAYVRFFDYFSLVPWMARLNGVRYIVFTEANGGEWRGPAWKRRLLRLRTSLVCRPFTRSIAISRFIAGRLANVGVSESKIDVVYNGIDTDRFSPRAGGRLDLGNELVVAPEDILISTIGALLPIKNAHVPIHATAELARRRIPARLLLAGDGPLRPELECVAKRLGIEDRVHFLGHRRDPDRILSGSDIVAIASVGEAFGNVIAEAMACGVPVVGTRSGAIPELIMDGETGFLAEPNDPVSFADALEKLASDPVRRRAMGCRALESARRNFGIDRAVEGTLQVFQKMWDSSAPR
jgi:glycosyltransferase involved in cell wall biosynthesis